MDPNESSGLSSYFQHPSIPPPLSAAVLNAFPTNGVVPSTNPHAPIPNPTTATASTTSSPMAYSNTVPPAVSAGLESVKRKRGRPRKYGTPEEAAAAKRLASASNPVSPPKKRKQAFIAGLGDESVAASSSPSKKFQLAPHGTAGDKFKPHVITVAAGEDVGQKIMFFMQQNKAEMCILSVSGSVSNASLRQPATSGGSVSYEGRFDILSLCGSYVHSEHGGRTGGLSICLANNDGQIIGGGVAGPLTAAGPIQIIVGTFVIDNKKDITLGETTGGRSPSPAGGASLSGVSFRSPSDSYQNIGGSHFLNMQ